MFKAAKMIKFKVSDYSGGASYENVLKLKNNRHSTDASSIRHGNWFGARLLLICFRKIN
jgi:hypothetical protein